MSRSPVFPLIIVFHLLAGAAVADTTARQIDPALTALMAKWDQPEEPGFSLGILKDGEVLYSGGFGAANLEHGIEIGADSVFDIASVSKQFAGMSVAMLSLEGKISLDADIRDYLDEVPDLGHTITVRHLLHHTSGVRDWVGLMVMSGLTMEDVISFDQIMRMVRLQTHNSFAPGDASAYSNTGYNLLARLVEVASGSSFPEWTTRHLFQPLGMNDTYFPSDHDIVKAGRVDSYARRSEGGFQRMGNQLTALGSSSLHTTANDLLKWLRNFETGEVGGKAALELITTPGSLNSGEPVPYGFGLAVNEWREHRLWAHGGSWAGFRTWLAYFPDDRIGVVVLGNHAGFEAGSVGQSIAEVLLGLEAEEKGEESAGKPVVDSAPYVPDSPVVLDDYVGHFLVEPIGIVFGVTLEDDVLVLNALGKTPLTPMAKDLFAGGEVKHIEFRRDESGEVSGVVADMFGSEFTGKRVNTEIGAATAANFVGAYYSPELDTTYTIVSREGALFATHHRNEDLQLFMDGEDRFRSTAWYMSSLEFDRDESGAVAGLRASSPRNFNVVFVRR